MEKPSKALETARRWMPEILRRHVMRGEDIPLETCLRCQSLRGEDAESVCAQEVIASFLKKKYR